MKHKNSEKRSMFFNASVSLEELSENEMFKVKGGTSDDGEMLEEVIVEGHYPPEEEEEEEEEEEDEPEDPWEEPDYWDNPGNDEPSVPAPDTAVVAYNSKFNLPPNIKISSDGKSLPAGFSIKDGYIVAPDGSTKGAMTLLMGDGSIKIFVSPGLFNESEINITGTLLHESIHAWNYHENASQMLLDPQFSEYVRVNSEYIAYDEEATYYQSLGKYVLANNALDERDAYTGDSNYDPNSGLSTDPHWKPL